MSEESAVVERRPEAIRSALRSAAWVERSTFGVLQLNGNDRLDLLHRLTTNDLTGMAAGDGRQTVLLTEKARIIDVATLLEDAGHALLLVEKSVISTVNAWLKKYIIMDDVRVKNVSDQYRMIEVMGPRSGDVVRQLTGKDVAGLAKTHWVRTDGDDPITIVRMPSTCEVSYWLLASPERVESIANALKEQGDALPQLQAEEDEYLRVMAGMGRIGHEWSEAYNPLEAGLLHLTSFTKGCYIGQEVVARLDSYNKVKQRVMAVVGTEEFAQGDSIVADNVVVGAVTSVVHSLDSSRYIGLAYIRGEHANENTSITIRRPTSETTVTIHLPPVEE